MLIGGEIWCWGTSNNGELKYPLLVYTILAKGLHVEGSGVMGERHEPPSFSPTLLFPFSCLLGHIYSFSCCRCPGQQRLFWSQLPHPGQRAGPLRSDLGLCVPAVCTHMRSRDTKWKRLLLGIQCFSTGFFNTDMVSMM